MNYSKKPKTVPAGISCDKEGATDSAVTPKIFVELNNLNSGLMKPGLLFRGLG
jgi:hypothetical protein